MYYFGEPGDMGADPIRTGMPGAFRSDSGILPLYRLQAPYMLMYMTSRPAEEDCTLRINSIYPDGAVCIGLDKTTAESAPHILHQHDYIELLYVVQGNIYQTIETRRHLYTPGSFCLLNRNVRHIEEYTGEFRLIFLELSDAFLHQLLQALSFSFFREENRTRCSELEHFLRQNADGRTTPEKDYIDFIPVHDAEWMRTHIDRIFDALASETLTPGRHPSIQVLHACCRLFALLEEPENFQTTPVRIGTGTENALFNRITACMEARRGRIGRQELASELHYSGDYLNKIVKKYTGLSLYAYGMTFAMKEAAALLAAGADTAQAAAALNFTNITQFYRCFESIYQMTPAQYRLEKAAGARREDAAGADNRTGFTGRKEF